MDIKKLEQTEGLEYNDFPSIITIKVSDAVQLLWQDNPKLHDVGGTIQSIVKHGFQELPKFDSNLINVQKQKGAIKAGNGRIECLFMMEKDGGYDLPRGLAKIDKTGEWVMPLLIGTDATSEALAIAYAIDSNNLTMSGGDFTGYDYMRMWDSEKYIALLEKAGKSNTMPASVSLEDLDTFLNLDLHQFDFDKELDDTDHGQTHVIKVQVNNFEMVEEAIIAVRELVESHEDWDANIL